MNKTWLIAKTTYRHSVGSANFLILTFAVPVLMVIAGAVPLISAGGSAPAVLGVVDLSGQLTPVQQVQLEEQAIEIQTYASAEAAETAYEASEMGGYIVVPTDYFEGQAVRYYSDESPSDELDNGLVDFLRQSMAPDAPAWVLERLDEPAKRTFVALNTGDRVSEGLPVILRFVTPLALSIFISMTLMFTSSQMGIAVIREKDQRAMEMIISSVEPKQLVAGKVLGISLLSLTQMSVWAIGAVLGVGLFFSDQIDLASLSVPWNALLWAVLLGVPGYLVYSVVTAGIGIIAGDSQQAQQLAGIFGIFGVAPLWFTSLLISAPNGSFAVSLTLFPLTAPAIALIRMAMTVVPLWQLLASLAILLVSLVAGIWAVGRIFRAAMLMYGQSFSPRQIWRALRQAA